MIKSIINNVSNVISRKLKNIIVRMSWKMTSGMIAFSTKLMTLHNHDGSW